MHKQYFRQAIENLSGCPYYSTDFNTILDWGCDDITQPTQEQINSEIQRLKDEYNSLEYQIVRADHYPPIGDQLDALFHAGVFPEDMAEKIQAVKDAYPKPTGDN